MKPNSFNDSLGSSSISLTPSNIATTTTFLFNAPRYDKLVAIEVNVSNNEYTGLFLVEIYIHIAYNTF